MKDIDISRIIDQTINEMFRGSSRNLLKEDDTVYTTRAKKDLVNAFQKYYDKNKGHVANMSHNLGINLDKGKKRGEYEKEMLGKHGSYEGALKQMSPEIRDAIDAMRKIKDPNTSTEERQELYRKFGGPNFQRYRDILDKLSLTPTYDQERANAAGVNSAPFGTNYRAIDKDGNEYLTNSKPKETPAKDAKISKKGKILSPGSPKIPADKVIGYDYENLDLTDVPEAEIIKYFTSGTRKSHRFEEDENNPQYVELAEIAKMGVSIRAYEAAISEVQNGNRLNPNIPQCGVNVKNDISKNMRNKGISDDELISYFNNQIEAIKGNCNKLNAQYGKNFTPKDAFEILKNLYFKAEFNKVLNSKFGYDFKIPGAMYTYGNSKLPNDTLVINFTTAHRCPAWKDCLVGYACYARGSEHNYEGLHKKNSNLHLMWQSSREDPELMTAMQRVIKTYLVNPEEMARTLLTNKNTRNKWIKFLTNGKTSFNQINGDTNNTMEMPKNPILDIGGEDEDEDIPGIGESRSILGKVLEEMEMESAKPKVKKLRQPKGAGANLGSYIYSSNWSQIFSKYDVAAIKANPKVFRARFIRLNEEGDFIGQWLLDAFDVFAGELKLLGISTAAYTCRNLNFTKIKNIILNASTLDVGTKGEEDGNVSNAIARRFFAVSNELYDSLEDTYVRDSRPFNYVPDKNDKNGWNGSRAIVPLHPAGGDNWGVKYALKPYTLDGNTTPVEFNDRFGPNGPTQKRRLYYKCPCGRYGDVLKDGKPLKMDCYLCRMCYEPKNQKVGEIYVLVAVHGDNTDSFDMNRANSKRGINDTMATYREAREIFGNRLSEATQMSEQAGLKLVSENVINSAKAHIANIADSEASSMQTEGKNFLDMMNRMKLAENKRKKKIFD